MGKVCFCFCFFFPPSAILLQAKIMVTQLWFKMNLAKMCWGRGLQCFQRKQAWVRLGRTSHSLACALSGPGRLPVVDRMNMRAKLVQISRNQQNFVFLRRLVASRKHNIEPVFGCFFIFALDYQGKKGRLTSSAT